MKTRKKKTNATIPMNSHVNTLVTQARASPRYPADPESASTQMMTPQMARTETVALTGVDPERRPKAVCPDFPVVDSFDVLLERQLLSGG